MSGGVSLHRRLACGCGGACGGLDPREVARAALAAIYPKAADRQTFMDSIEEDRQRDRELPQRAIFEALLVTGAPESKLRAACPSWRRPMLDRALTEAAVEKAARAAEALKTRETIEEAERIMDAFERARALAAEGLQRVKFSPAPDPVVRLVSEVARSLGIPAPAVKMFREAMPWEPVSDHFPVKVRGIAYPARGAIYVRDSLSWAECRETVPHEVFHLWEHHSGRECDEAAAERYGREWAAGRRIAA